MATTTEIIVFAGSVINLWINQMIKMATRMTSKMLNIGISLQHVLNKKVFNVNFV